MKAENNPCYGCTERRATDGYNCHSDCPKYAGYRRMLADKAVMIKQKKAVEELVTETRVRAIRKTSRTKRKQNAWKGT